MSISVIKKQVVPYLKRQGVIKVGIFGSVARGEQTPRSDIDFLLKFGHGITLMEMARIKLNLEEKTGRKVDILTYNGINSKLKKIILDEQKVIYEKRS